MQRSKSKAIYDRACGVIPGGVNSPVRSFRHLRMAPLIVESGKGGRIWDVDGHSYIDFCCSWGALILGHAHPAVIRGASEQMQKGTSFGIATEIELDMASRVVHLMPSIEKIRFVSSGTEAGMTAMRLARGVTERPKIVKFTGHYHGHSDALLIQAGSGAMKINPLATSKGVNPNTIADTICLPFNDFEAVRSLFRSEEGARIAGVILEPVTGNMGVVLPEDGFLECLRELTARNGSLLIFDEVITGFRLGIRGAQGLYGIDPDLTCLGKVIGGGFPVAAVGGKAKFLDHLAPLGSVYQAGTLSGNPVAMRGGLETLAILEKEGFYEELHRKAEAMTAPLRHALRNKNGCLQQAGSMFNLFFGVKKVRCKEDLKQLDEEMFIRFFHYLFERGIYISPSSHEAWFMTAAHTDVEIATAVGTMIEFIEKYV
ncbi:MAG: glutamate-1-semialdehyde 2,1-aminomutase [Verrucomicrobia bacterium]|nr:glutamate-1-semialdehyde 2,1-aminomutase [Verrucomicrobiota bacterium]MDE3047342.1 glutamate-1-semialdehyde 2,1-aminomutase [Verrucomicrobiota bacterium]